MISGLLLPAFSLVIPGRCCPYLHAPCTLTFVLDLPLLCSRGEFKLGRPAFGSRICFVALGNGALP